MLIEAFVNQEGTSGLDIFWIILPLLCCFMAMAQGRGGGERSAPETISESWYTIQDIESAYKSIEKAVSDWRKEAEEKSKDSKRGLRGLFRGKPKERFIVEEATPPRLCRVSDPSGPIYFELTEVEGGGSVVKATFSSELRSRMAKFKANLPLKIPATPIGNRCPVCGKPVLPEFNLCPYCGEKIIKE